MNSLLTDLAKINAKLFYEVIRYDKTHEMAEVKVPFTAEPAVLALDGTKIQAEVIKAEDKKNTIKFTVTEGEVGPVTVGLRLEFNDWAKENYVLFPSGAYNGNRYRAVDRLAEKKYDPSELPDTPVTITKVHRLNINDGESRIQFNTGDLSTPSFGFHAPGQKQGFLFQTDQGSRLGNHGMILEENADRSDAVFQFKAPCVRRDNEIKGDRGIELKTGDEVELDFSIHVFDSPNIQSIFNYFLDVRNEYRGDFRWRNEVPFSTCWHIQEKKYNKQNWVEKYSYYSVGMRECSSQDWQTGWVGGPNAAYGLLSEGHEVTRERSLREFDFIFGSGGQFPYGYVKGGFHDGTWNDKSAYLRYSGDTLYFMMKMLLLTIQREPGFTPPEVWTEGLKNLAAAFCNTWEKYGQFGHHHNGYTGEMTVGGTACAGIAPGGLALAYQYFNEPRFLQVAREGARKFHKDFVLNGLTNGGPGDIVQCPDSESCAGLLAGFMTLYEVDPQDEWLQAAKDTAAQCASWTVTYDYVFPPDSTFGELDMLTTGTVYANVQNKHSAPGMCTLSGVSLLKLFRATGDEVYLEMLKEMAHAIPQYLSREDRPIISKRPNERWPVMDPGWMNERINMSDWEVRGSPGDIGVGEIFGGSCWCEATMILTAAEVPGIYYQPDTGVLSVPDHVNVKVIDKDGKKVLEIENPTKFEAEVKLLIENSTETNKPMGAAPMADAEKAKVPAHETIEYKI